MEEVLHRSSDIGLVRSKLNPPKGSVRTLLETYGLWREGRLGVCHIKSFLKIHFK